MVDATRSLGVRAQRVDAASLLFADASFDVVVAAWMLYHVGDLHVTLGEVRRVLRPGAPSPRPPTVTGTWPNSSGRREASRPSPSSRRRTAATSCACTSGTSPSATSRPGPRSPPTGRRRHTSPASIRRSRARSRPSPGHGASRASPRSSPHADEDTGRGMPSSWLPRQIHPVCERPTNAALPAPTLNG